jgi:hypothetical protein
MMSVKLVRVRRKDHQSCMACSLKELNTEPHLRKVQGPDVDFNINRVVFRLCATHFWELKTRINRIE